MNAKRATLRLYVAVTGLLASVFELAGAFVRLATALLERAARTVAPKGPQASQARQEPPMAPPPAQFLPTFATAPTVVETVPRTTVAMTGDERLTSALLSLGFHTKNVRAFAATVRGRQEPLEVLVKEGIVALSAN
jgi:hypothetical protein